MKLQALVNGTWEYVFCRNDRKVVTTKDKNKALRGDALQYFQRHFSDIEFRTA